MSQSEIAQVVGVSATMVWKIHRGYSHRMPESKNGTETYGEANARLIAAAPAYKAATLAFMAWLDSANDGFPDAELLDAAQAKAELALAKDLAPLTAAEYIERRQALIAEAKGLSA